MRIHEDTYGLMGTYIHTYISLIWDKSRLPLLSLRIQKDVAEDVLENERPRWQGKRGGEPSRWKALKQTMRVVNQRRKARPTAHF